MGAMVDIGELTQPIDSEQPGGPDLRLDPADLTFQTLKDASTSVDASIAAAESDVRDIRFENYTIAGRARIDAADANVEIGAFVSDVTFTAGMRDKP